MQILDVSLTNLSAPIGDRENNNDNGSMTVKQLKKRIKYYFNVRRISGNWHIYTRFYSSNTGMNTDWDSLVWAGIENSDEDYADQMVEIITENTDLQNNIRNNFIQVYNSMNRTN